MRIETHNLDGTGPRRTQVYDMPTVSTPTTFGWGANEHIEQWPDYWASVTDVPCPHDNCDGTIRWAEAGYVPGYRICDGCGRHFMAKGNAAAPTLLRVGSRRSKVRRGKS